MDARQKADLDRYITGDYGEDSGNARQLSRTETTGELVQTDWAGSPIAHINCPKDEEHGQ